MAVLEARDGTRAMQIAEREHLLDPDTLEITTRTLAERAMDKYGLRYDGQHTFKNGHANLSPRPEGNVFIQVKTDSAILRLQTGPFTGDGGVAYPPEFWIVDPKTNKTTKANSIEASRVAFDIVS